MNYLWICWRSNKCDCYHNLEQRHNNCHNQYMGLTQSIENAWLFVDAPEKIAPKLTQCVNVKFLWKHFYVDINYAVVTSVLMKTLSELWSRLLTLVFTFFRLLKCWTAYLHCIWMNLLCQSFVVFFVFCSLQLLLTSFLIDLLHQFLLILNAF